MGISHKKTGQRHMSDLDIAQSLYLEINKGHGGKIKGMLGRVYDALKHAHKLRSDDENNKPWTYRKVRGIWENKAIVRHYEMMELADAAVAKKQERESLRTARKEHAEFIAQTCRLEALLIAQDPAFHSQEIQRLGSIRRGMDSTRNQDGD